MASIRLGTFNCENLFFRYRLLNDVPKPFQKKSEKPQVIEFSKLASSFKKISDLLSKPGGTDIFTDRKSFEKFISSLDDKELKSILVFLRDGSFVNRLKGSVENIEPLSHTQREHTAQVIYKNKPDVVGVVEVESLPVLKEFYYKYISKHHKLAYQLLIDGNDERGIDVGALSTKDFPINSIRTHQFDYVPSPPMQRVFSRDCLEIDIGLPNDKTLTIFMNHFKSQIGGGSEKRKKQAQRINELVKQRFGSQWKNRDFVVMGDLNCVPTAPELEPLTKDLQMANPFENLDESERWSHLYIYRDKKTDKLQKAEVSQLDYILLSPSIASNNKNAKPIVERGGLVYYADVTEKLAKKDPKAASVYDTAKRFKGVDKYGSEASDHCGVFLDLKI